MNDIITSRFDTTIEDARTQALSLYQQITAHLSNARTYAVMAAQRHSRENTSQPDLFGVESEVTV